MYSERNRRKTLISLGICFLLFVIDFSMPSSSSNDDSETQAKLENNEEDKVIAKANIPKKN